MRVASVVVLGGLGLGACDGRPGASVRATASATPTSTTAPMSSASVTPAHSELRAGASATSGASSATEPPSNARAAPHAIVYGWGPTSRDSLEQRFAAPKDFHRVPAAPGSFAAFLRSLPLLPRTAEVRSYRDETIVSANDARLGAVVDIDVGTANLQQCADSVIRMHAEWRRQTGRGDVTYRSSSGFPMTYARYRMGDRFVIRGTDLTWEHRAAANDSRASFRSYLDQVFTYANTVSLARDTQTPDRHDVRAGDFFVLPGAPGHAVLVLDIVHDATGKQKALLGQGFMPAQSFHVLRDEAAKSVWFSLDEESIATPFWSAPFPWSSLRRFE
ncbi:MAG: DUF4846 domain-containing protein [Polyangiaceae bacterium]